MLKRRLRNRCCPSRCQTRQSCRHLCSGTRASTLKHVSQLRGRSRQLRHAFILVQNVIDDECAAHGIRMVVYLHDGLQLSSHSRCRASCSARRHGCGICKLPQGHRHDADLCQGAARSASHVEHMWVCNICIDVFHAPCRCINLPTSPACIATESGRAASRVATPMCLMPCAQCHA